MQERLIDTRQSGMMTTQCTAGDQKITYHCTYQMTL